MLSMTKPLGAASLTLTMKYVCRQGPILLHLVLLLQPPSERHAMGFTATPDGMIYGFGGAGKR